MANSTITMTISITMIVLFTVAILGFSIGFATDNDSIVRVDQDDNITSMRVETQDGLSDFKDDSEETYTSIINSTIETGSDVVKSPSVFSVGWGNLFSSFTNIFTGGYRIIFGSGGTFGIFLTALLAIIGFTFALYLIKAWRGNP
jgi:hypothetical protein